ncbi:MAG: AAA-like domain-containing protein [Polyangiaceae bacterium]
MGSLGWIAISDLHAASRGGSGAWLHAEDELRRDLDRIHKHAGPVDVVFCTGDLVATGTREDLDVADARLEALFRHLADLGSTPGLLIVPGNHDLQQADQRAVSLRPLLQWSHDPEVRANVFWHETQGKPLRDLVAASFADFTQWLAAWRAAHPFPESWSFAGDGLLPGDFAATVRTGDLTLGVAGLNSAFLQIAGRVPRGGVAIHPHQLHHVTGDPRAWAAQHDVCFLLTHHPPDWLTPDALPLYQGAIFRPELFAAHFCGHMHEPQLAPPPSSSSPARLFQSPSLLGLDHWVDSHGAGIARAQGYSAGRLLVDDARRAVLRVWPRAAQPVRGSPGRLRLIPNHTDFELDDENAFTVDLGIRPLPPPVRSLRFPSLRPVSSPGSVPSLRPTDLPPVAAPPPSSEAPDAALPFSEPFDPDASLPDEDEPEPPGLGYSERWYVPNEAKEQLILGTLRHPGAPVVVTAPPFSGKSTVLQRIVSRLRKEHRDGHERCVVILVDLGSLSDATLADPPAFFLEVASMLVDGYERALREARCDIPADTDTWIERAWKRPGSPEARLTNLVERRILTPERNRTVLAFDRADRFVGRPCGDPMARMLRQWVRAGALGDELWAQFRLALAAAGSSLYFYAPDAVSELFASATHVRIESFGLADVRAMAHLYGARWTDDELRHVVDLVGGQPYLCRMILFLERTGVPKTELLDEARLKIEHCATVLRQVWLRVAEQPDIRKPLCLLLHDPSTKLTTDEYHRLYQAGLVRRDGDAYVLPNKLVASYFREQC